MVSDIISNPEHYCLCHPQWWRASSSTCLYYGHNHGDSATFRTHLEHLYRDGFGSPYYVHIRSIRVVEYRFSVIHNWNARHSHAHTTLSTFIQPYRTCTLYYHYS